MQQKGSGYLLRVYEYANCSTCKNALRFLDAEKVHYESVPIVERPPTVAELKKMLAFQGGNLKKLFNTSGVQYRELKIGEKLGSMSEAQALELLATNGKLVKRPFALGPEGGVVGFKVDEWKAFLQAHS